MPVKLNNFQETINPVGADYLVGYTNTNAGGERRFSLNTLRSWLLSQITNHIIPAGTIAIYGANSAPAGWLPCDGRSTAGYPALAAAVGATVPDLRGYFVRGAGTNSDGSASGAFGQKQQDAIQAFRLNNAGGGAQLKGMFASTTRTARFPTFDGNWGMQPGGDFGDGGGANITRANNDYADETRPKNIPLLYIIKV